MRKIWNTLYFVFISFLLCSCNNKETTSGVQIKKLDYPSASAVEYFDGKLYVMGDDATNMIILDTNLNIVDSVPIVLFPEKRIPKNIKPDLEASILYSALNETMIFLFGSGSLDPYRDSAWKFNLRSNTKDNIYLQPLYSRIKSAGVEQINIESACYVPGKLILANRGNKGYPYNHLISIDEEFLRNDTLYRVKVIPFETQNDTASFKGISGLCYIKEGDKLIMTVSTEDTRNSYDDGAIGKSYLWMIDSISHKLNHTILNPDRVIDLEEIDKRFKGYKIESVTVISQTNELINLVLVADNDNGSSTIFKMSIKRE